MHTSKERCIWTWKIITSPLLTGVYDFYFLTFPSKLLIDCRIYFTMVTRIQYVYYYVDLMCCLFTYLLLFFIFLFVFCYEDQGQGNKLSQYTQVNKLHAGQ
jgi:hypothetical protein